MIWLTREKVMTRLRPVINNQLVKPIANKILSLSVFLFNSKNFSKNIDFNEQLKNQTGLYFHHPFSSKCLFVSNVNFSRSTLPNRPKSDKIISQKTYFKKSRNLSTIFETYPHFLYIPIYTADIQLITSFHLNEIMLITLFFFIF